ALTAPRRAGRRCRGTSPRPSGRDRPRALRPAVAAGGEARAAASRPRGERDLTRMPDVVLADGIGQTLPQKGVQTLLLLGCLGLAWAAVGARDVRVPGRPRYASRALALLGHGGPGAGVRRSPRARDQDRTGASLDGREVSILAPRPQQVLKGNPAT